MCDALGFMIVYFHFRFFVNFVVNFVNAFSYRLLFFKGDVLWQFCEFVLCDELNLCF
jgi:hypothetical protein